MNFIADDDPEVWAAIAAEIERQEDGLEMIASENYTSPAVMQAVGSVLTNKYAEGYPGRRYYGGCEFVDEIETLAIERAKTLFGAAWANVQPHSGSQANQAAYAAVVSPGDTVMGLNLAHGGHLTHGHALNFSGKTYNIVPYGVRKVVELGRALATEPKLMLLDEPSSGLNPEETDEMAFWIEDIQKGLGITVLMVEHDMNLVSRVSTRVLALNEGKVIAEGTPGEVQSHPAVVEAYLGGGE